MTVFVAEGGPPVLAEVTDVEYRGSSACTTIVGGAAAVALPAAAEGLGAGAAFGLLFAAAALAALALLAARRRRRPSAEEEGGVPVPRELRLDRDFSLISNSLDGSLYEHVEEDPHANTVDVHTCKSLYCNCNKDRALSATTFLPVPRGADLARTLRTHGIAPAPDAAADASSPGRGSILRVPIRAQLEGAEERSLTPVREIAHDSEIDTDYDESVDPRGADGVPPPPPLTSHPAYGAGTAQRADSADEMSPCGLASSSSIHVSATPPS